MSSVRGVDDAPVILTADQVAERLHVDRKTVYGSLSPLASLAATS